MNKDIKFGLLPVSFILVVLLSLVIIATPVFATSATAPTSPVAVQQGKVFLLRGTVTFDQAADGDFMWGPVYWYDNDMTGVSTPTDNFCLENRPSVYWTDGTPVENLKIDNYAIPNGWQVEITTDGENLIQRNGTFYVDIWLRAASPDGSLHRPGNDNIYFAMDQITLFEPAMVTVPAGPIVLQVSEWTSGVVVRAPENSWSIEQDNAVAFKYYVEGENAPLMWAEKRGAGKVAVAAWAAHCRNGYWNQSAIIDAGLDKTPELLHSLFQWMVPGAENVLWWSDNRVYNVRWRCANLCDNLQTKFGYTVDNAGLISAGPDNAENRIDETILAGYDILVIPQLQLQALVSGSWTRYTGGSPELLVQSDIDNIVKFVTVNGKGLLIMDGSDYGGNYYKVHNRILVALGVSARFQSEQINAGPPDNLTTLPCYNFRGKVQTACPGAGYQYLTGLTEIGVRSVGSLVLAPPTLAVTVDVSPTENSGISPVTVNYTVTVTNTGNAWDNYYLSVSTTSTWTYSLSKSRMKLAPSASDTATLSVTIPGGTPSCTRDSFTVIATSFHDNTVTSSDTCTAHSLGTVDFVFISPKSKFGENENVYFYITIKNTGDNMDNFSLTIENIDNAEWPVAFENIIAPDNRIENILPGENKVVTLTVTIPDNAILGFGNEIWVKATSQADNTKSDNDNCVAYAGRFGVQVAISPGEKSGPPGTTVTFTVTVTNTGNVADNYNIIASSGRGWSASPEASPLSIPASGSGTTTLRVTIPDGATHCTRDDVTVTARSITDTVENSASCTVHVVKIIRGVSVSISPSSQVGQPDATLSYTVTVTNTGEATDNFDLRISGGAGWSPRISPSSLTLATGASGTATLTVTVPSGAAEGDSTTIVAIATSRADPSASGSASCRATASAPAGPGVPPSAPETPGLAIAVMVGAAATIALSLGFILLRKP